MPTKNIIPLFFFSLSTKATTLSFDIVTLIVLLIFLGLIGLLFYTIQNKNNDLSAKNQKIAQLNNQLKDKIEERDKALEENQRELSLIYNNTQDFMGLMQLDTQQKIILESFNQPYLDYLRQAGLLDQEESIRGMRFENYMADILKMPREEIQQRLIYVDTVLSSKRLLKYETQLTNFQEVDNAVFEVTLTPIVKSDGSIDRIIFVLHDLTNQIKAQKALTKSEKQLSTIYNASQDIIGLLNVNEEGKYMVKSFNKTTIDFYRRLYPDKKLDSLIGVEVRSLFTNIYGLSTSAIEYRMKNIKHVFEDHEVFKYQSVFSPKGKNIDLYFETIISPILDDQGRCTQALYVARDITERKKQKAKIVESQRRLSMVFNGSKDASFIFDVKKNGALIFAEANQAFVEAVKSFIPGYDIKELYGKEADYFLLNFMKHDKKEADKRLKFVRSIIEKKEPVEYNEFYITSDGEKLELEITATPIINKNDDCEQLLFVSRNVTKKFAAQRALAISEKRLATIYNSSQDIIALINCGPDGNYSVESINQTGADFLKRNKLSGNIDQLVGLDMEIIFDQLFALPPEIKEERMSGLDQVYKKHKTLTYRSPLIIKSKNINIDFETVISPVLDPSGQCTHILYSARDISESEAAKRKLIANERRLASILKSTTDQMAIVDITQSGKLILEDTNKAFNSAWRKAGSQIDIKTLYQKDIIPLTIQLMNIPPAYVKQRMEDIKNIIESKKPGSFEEEYHAPNQKRYILDITIAPILNKEGICTRLLFVIRDTTHKQRAKEKMISKILETEDRERSRFAKELHDSLGQNLTAASINFNLVKKGMEQLPKVQQKNFAAGIKFLKEAIEESRNIAHNLMPQSITDFGYVLTIESLLDNLRENPEIKFTFYNNLEGQRLPVELELSLYRITQEAINNILKHAKATQVTIQLIKHLDSLILTIEDNGIGFHPEKKTSSFGLNSMKNRVRAHSGALDIDSHPGKGTSITLEIPVEFVN